MAVLTAASADVGPLDIEVYAQTGPYYQRCLQCDKDPVYYLWQRYLL